MNLASGQLVVERFCKRRNKTMRSITTRSALALVLWLWLHAVQSSKILVFVAFPMKSYHIGVHPLVRGLAERGHNVTFFSTVPLEEPVPESVRQVVAKSAYNTVRNVLPEFVEFGSLSVPMISYYMNLVIYATVDETLRDPEAQKIIHSDEKYDLVIHESFVSEPVVALQHKFKAPGVSVMFLTDSAWAHEISGLTNNPAYMIDLKSDSTDSLTFFQRIVNLYHLVSTLLVSYAFLYYHQQMMDKHFNYTGWEDRPSIFNLLSDQALILVNSHHSIGYNFPRAPHVKEVGGINLRPPKPLPKELKQKMDDAKGGVIYFNFGSNINMKEIFSQDVLDAFVNVFSQLKVMVLWKWKGQERPPVPENVYMSEWFPQQDILVHENLKLFITHGGHSSVIEAVNNAVPSIGIPFFTDQRRNVRRIVTAGFGLALDHTNLTETSISWAVNEILNNQRYKEEAVRTQRIFQDRPMKPTEESIYWIEYVLKHGNILRPRSVQMPLYQLLLLDVFGAIVAAVVLVSYIVKKLYCRITSHIRTINDDSSEKLKGE